MGFRDEREALRFQVTDLERQVAQRTRELEEQKDLLRALEADIELEVGLLSGRGWILVLVPVVVFSIVIGAILLSAGSGSKSETIFGDVRVATGTPPVPVGARCTLFVTPVNDEDSSYNTDIEVLCNGRLVYGGEDLGAINCSQIDGRAVHCMDSEFTINGGDPMLVFDRRIDSTVVEDRGPDWRLEIAFAPPPLRLP